MEKQVIYWLAYLLTNAKSPMHVHVNVIVIAFTTCQPFIRHVNAQRMFFLGGYRVWITNVNYCVCRVYVLCHAVIRYCRQSR